MTQPFAEPAGMPLSGAVDLAALAAASQARQQRQEAPPGAVAVIDVTEESFQADVVDRSSEVPVVLDFWASWCGPCKQLSPVLEKLAAEHVGEMVLAKIDVDANPRLAQAFQVQGIPQVLAVVGGRAVPGFSGAVPEAQARQYVEELLTLVAQLREQGAMGAPTEEEPAEDPAGPPPEPELVDAEQAMRVGDFQGAGAAYRRLGERIPGSVEATLGAARMELLDRTAGMDPDAVRQAAAQDPSDVSAVLAAADLDVLDDDVDTGFDRLVALVRTTRDDDRDRARAHLLRLFDVLVPDDPRLARGRRALSSALF